MKQCLVLRNLLVQALQYFEEELCNLEAMPFCTHQFPYFCTQVHPNFTWTRILSIAKLNCKEPVVYLSESEKITLLSYLLFLSNVLNWKSAFWKHWRVDVSVLSARETNNNYYYYYCAIYCDNQWEHIRGDVVNKTCSTKLTFARHECEQCNDYIQSKTFQRYNLVAVFIKVPDSYLNCQHIFWLNFWLKYSM